MVQNAGRLNYRVPPVAISCTKYKYCKLPQALPEGFGVTADSKEAIHFSVRVLSNEFEFEILKEWLKEEKDRFGDEAGLRLMRELVREERDRFGHEAGLRLMRELGLGSWMHKWHC